ncbi:MAG: hypothetical protein NTW87_21255 [Planctomycetota bacterium]|nr:hypothetical protein [Planctomycetota bacterium]
MGESDPPGSSSAAKQLWYCVKCTRMITPPGAEGFVTPEGDHLCGDCAPPKRTSSLRLKTIDAPRSGSKPTLKAIQPATPSAASSATGKSGVIRPVAAKAAEQRFPVPLVIGAGAVVVLVLGFLVLSSKSKPEGERPVAAKPAAAPARTAAASGTVPEKPAGNPEVTGAAPAQPEASRAMPGPSFVSRTDGSRPPSEPRKGVPLPEQGPMPGLAAAGQPAAENSLQLFQEQLKKAAQSDEKGRYGVALEQLKDLKTRYASAPWWEANKDQHTKTEQFVQQHQAEYAAEADDARKQVLQSDKPDFLAKTEASWKARLDAVVAGGPPADEAAARPAQQVLKAVAEKRAQLAEKRRQSTLADVTQQLDGMERQLKNPGINYEAFRKTLCDLEAHVAEDGVLDAKLTERLAGLRFDLSAGREGELGFFRAPVKATGKNTVEVVYDCASPNQLTPWMLEDGNDAALDSQKAAIVMKHGADKHNKRDTRMMRLPFDFFSPAQWAIEVDVSLASNKNKMEYGILVCDGGGNIIRFGVEQATYKDVHAFVGGAYPNRGKVNEKPRYLPGLTKDPVRLKMTCAQGIVTCAATNASGRAITFDPEKAGFETRFMGFYIQIHDREEDSCAVFSKLRLSGQLNLEKMRSAAAAAALQELKTGRSLFKDWLILGPFKGDQQSQWEKAGTPRSTLDVGAMLKLPPKALPVWLRPCTPCSFGTVDLAALLKPNESVYAYALAEIQAKQDAEGLLLLGSDDGVAVWLDGAEIHRYPKPRGVKPDDDKVPLKLSAGVHTLAFRIDQGGGDWGFCARLVSTDEKGPMPGANLRCPNLPK